MSPSAVIKQIAWRLLGRHGDGPLGSLFKKEHVVQQQRGQLADDLQLLVLPGSVSASELRPGISGAVPSQ